MSYTWRKGKGAREAKGVSIGGALGATATRRISHGFLYGFLTLVCVAMAFPIVWMISSSFKPDADIFEFPFLVIPRRFFPRNYVNVWERLHYARLLGNTIFVTAAATALQLITSTLAGYAFAKVPFRGNRVVFLCYLATLMVPFQVVMIPQFTLIRMMGLTNKLWGIVLILAFSPFGVFMMRQFFKAIPMELSDAARIDGLGDFGIYSRIILPLSKPAVASLTIFTSVTVWNDFLTPLIYINGSAKWTIQLGLRSLFTEFTADYGAVMAGAVLTVLPVLVVFVLLQRQFVQGLTMSGMTG
jgi:multiple sugar transport system permease protein